MWLTRFALTRPVITAMVFIALVLFGFVAYFQIGRSQDPPGTTFPIVVVSASYSGASPQEMEKLVVKPIEDQLDGIDHLDQMSATAQEGTASVAVQFKLGTDLNIAAIDVQRRVDTARVYMPSDLDPPYVYKNGSDEPLLDLAVSSNSLSPTQLADVVTNRVEPVLKQIPNVESVDVYGARTREFHVEPNPVALNGLGATLGDVFGAVASNNANLPGGLMEQPTREMSVSVHADVNAASDLAAVPLPVPGSSSRLLTVGDVAATSDSFADQRSISKFNGQPRLYVSLSRDITSDEITSTKIARDHLVQIEQQFPQLTFHEIDAPADYTKKELNGVWLSLGEGILLTAIVMLLFLHAWRNALVVLVAIPTSIFSTFVVMRALGFTFDFMSLMALSLIIGILVDDSIVVLENITRHRDLGEAPHDAAINGRTEIGSAAIAITMVDIVVFLPIAFMPGIVGEYLKEFGLVVVVATLFSLLVSFTLTPLLAAAWSVKERTPARPKWFDVLGRTRTNLILLATAGVLFAQPWIYGHVLGVMLAALLIVNQFVQRYDRIVAFYRDVALPFALANGTFVVFVCAMLLVNAFALLVGGTATFFVNGVGFGGALAVFAARATRAGWRGGRMRAKMLAATLAIPILLAPITWSLGQLSFDFVPSEQTGAISMSLTYPPGTPILATSKYTDAIDNAILRIDGIQSVSSTVGRKPSGESSSVGGNYATLNAQTLENRRGDTNAIIEKIRGLAYLAPGGDFQVSGDSGGGSGVQISYALQGPDEELNAAADKVVAFLRKTPGSINVQSSAEVGAPRLNVQIDSSRAAVLGISPGDAAAAARIAIDGAVATKVRTPDGLVDVRVQFPAGNRNTLESLKAVRVRASDGTLVPLADVATFTTIVAPTKVERLNRERVVNVTGGVLPTYSLGAVTAPLQAALKQPGFLPASVHLEAQGDTQYEIEALINMALALVTAFMLVYMLMVILYSNFLEPLIVMCSVPLAIIGAFMGLAFMNSPLIRMFEPNSNQSLNIISEIGIVMLFGLVAKNGILLVDYSNTLVKRGMRVHDAVLQAAATRFRPILMTTFAMIFGMLPLALGFAEGAEFRQAMGTAIIGGLMSSLVLTLFVVPMIYNTWIGYAERRADRRAVVAEMQPVVAATASANA
ncbi:MAG TPA: efflux RND transporter permease subunit [Candidatus Baltobacteraceae bacterium]